MTAGQQRKVQRVEHLATALLPSPACTRPLEAQLQNAIRIITFPLLGLHRDRDVAAPHIRRGSDLTQGWLLASITRSSI